MVRTLKQTVWQTAVQGKNPKCSQIRVLRFYVGERFVTHTQDLIFTFLVVDVLNCFVFLNYSHTHTHTMGEWNGFYTLGALFISSWEYCSRTFWPVPVLASGPACMVLILGISFVAVLHWIPCFLISLPFCFLVYSLIYWNMSSVSFLRRGDTRDKVFENLNILRFCSGNLCLLISNFRLEIIIPQKFEALLLFFWLSPPPHHPNPQLPVLVGKKRDLFEFLIFAMKPAFFFSGSF